MKENLSLASALSSIVSYADLLQLLFSIPNISSHNSQNQFKVFNHLSSVTTGEWFRCVSSSLPGCWFSFISSGLISNQTRILLLFKVSKVCILVYVQIFCRNVDMSNTSPCMKNFKFSVRQSVEYLTLV